MKSLVYFLCAAVSAWPLAGQEPAQAAPTISRAAVSKEIANMEAALSEITGLQFHKDVPYAVITKADLHKFLEERMRDEVKPEEIHAQEIALKMFGFLPPDYDLKQATIELLTEQAAAFYDYHKKKLFILETPESTPDLHTEAEKMALSHELGHALADQNFHLDKYIRSGAQSDDASSARLAVMEGQASWLMTSYLSKLSTGQTAIPPGVLELMSHAVESSASDYPVFAKAPLYLRESLVFPYTAGMLFQNAIFEKLGPQAFSEVFRRAPQSTQQIIHPQKYLDRVAPVIPPVPSIPDAKRYRKVGDGTLGEFDLRVLLQQYAGKDEATALAPHMLGGIYQVAESKQDQKPLMTFAVNWDTPDAARHFLRDYRKALSGKSKNCEFTTADETHLEGRNDQGAFRVEVNEARFESLEGLPAQVH
jgi:hypothetical protein